MVQPSKKKSKQAQPEKSLVRKLIKQTLRAAEKSEDPQGIAIAYGIFVDWTLKIDQLILRQEVRQAAQDLLGELERASKKSQSPMKIALAFGILMDKNLKGFEETDMGKSLDSSAKRKGEYKELLKGTG